MPSILIVYDTTEGQTRKIARRVADTIAQAGRDVEVVDVRKPPSGFSVDRFDAILVGASIHMAKHSQRLVEFIGKHKARLGTIPSGFFSVSLSASGTEKERADACRYVEEFLQQTGWTPTLQATFAGGLLYRQYGFIKRWMMKKIAKDGGRDTDTSRNHEYTDWATVDRFAGEFLTHL